MVIAIAVTMSVIMAVITMSVITMSVVIMPVVIMVVIMVVIIVIPIVVALSVVMVTILATIVTVVMPIVMVTMMANIASVVVVITRQGIMSSGQGDRLRLRSRVGSVACLGRIEDVVRGEEDQAIVRTRVDFHRGCLTDDELHCVTRIALDQNSLAGDYIEALA